MKATLIKNDKLSSSFLATRASKGFVKGMVFSNSSSGDKTVDPPADYNLLDSMYRNDEVISTAFQTTVDMVSRNGFDIVPKKDSSRGVSRVDNANKRLFELSFEEVIDNIHLSKLIYGDSFLELRRNSKGTVTELHALETTEMRIMHDQHGKVEGYVQRPFNLSGLSKDQIEAKEKKLGVIFKPKDIVHFTWRKLGSQVYGLTPLQPIARVWSAKMEAHNYLLEAFKNLPPELMIHLKGFNEDDARGFQSILQRRKSVAGNIPVTWGKDNTSMELNTVGFDPGKGVLDSVEYLREADLMITRVPPVWIGMVNKDGANRGNSEAQIFSYETYVRKLQRDTENKITRELLPALGFSDLEFNYNPISAKNEKEVIQNASVFRSMGVKPDAIVKYLKRNGVTDIVPDDFEEEEAVDNQTSRNLTSPSRKGENPLTDSMTSNLDSSGVSSAGKAKTEEKDAKQR